MSKTLALTETGKFYQLNVKNGNSRIIHDFTEIFTDVDISATGSVYATTFTGLFSLDLATGAATQITSLSDNSNGLEIGDDGKAYVTHNSSSNISVYDLQTGLLEKTINHTAGVSAGDIEIDGSTAYISTVGNEILIFDLGSNTTTALISHEIDFLYGLQYDKSLIGFSGNTAYSIDINGGANTQLASFKIDGEIWGAAGISVYSQFGTRDADTLEGSYWNDRLMGKAGRDHLTGKQGSDVLKGGNGRDNMFGGAGNDRLIGGGGTDKMSGGAGKDVFVFSGNFGRDTIRDFQDNADTLVISSTLWSGDRTAAEIITDFAQVKNGNAKFTFDGGQEIIVKSITNLNSLIDDIDIV